MVAPVTGNDIGIRRAEIKQGIRETILCKDQDGRIGLRLKSVDNVSIAAYFCQEKSYCWIKLVVKPVCMHTHTQCVYYIYSQKVVSCIMLSYLQSEFESPPLAQTRAWTMVYINSSNIFSYFTAPEEYL